MTENKVKKSVHDMAQELLQLYAARQSTAALLLVRPSWQMEFEPLRENPGSARL